tara:strand:+ start:442 stop:849 length:408 start_codon:yes stop_codon:yes gene_type:complete
MRAKRCPIKRKEYYEKNKHKHKDKMNAYSQELRNTEPAKIMLATSRYRAKKKGLDHDITLDDIIIPYLCPLLKIEMIKDTDTAPSLDRVDSTKGYVKGNVMVISRKANTIKNDATFAEFETIYNNWSTLNAKDEC